MTRIGFIFKFLAGGGALSFSGGARALAGGHGPKMPLRGYGPGKEPREGTQF